MKAYSRSIVSLPAFVPVRGKGGAFSMGVVDPHTAYMDDSGTDARARIVSAALCISTIKRWKQFEAAWIAAERRFAFKNFHMTEFAGCRKGSWCRDCNNGTTNEKQHPWREWSNTKRHRVLEELIRIVCKYTAQGFGIALTKKDIDTHVQNPKLVSIASAEYASDHYTFAATVCGGELAKWRAKTKQFPELKIVFDGEHKLDLAKAFLREHQSKPQLNCDGLENWFDLDATGISFESRKTTRQLLAADMLAWVTAKIRVAALFPSTYQKMGGWSKEVSMVAFRFIDNGKLRFGFNTDTTLKEWLEKEIEYWEAKNSGKEECGFERFDQTMKALIAVPHSEIKAKLEAEKDGEKQKRKVKKPSAFEDRASS